MGRGPGPTNRPLPNLTEAEAAIYGDLVEDRFGPTIRLDQERVRRTLPVGHGVGAPVGLTGVLPLSTGARSWFPSVFVDGEFPRKGYSLLVVPRMQNSSDDLAGALNEAGVEARWLGADSVEIGGTTFVVDRMKVVRESDGALLAHVYDTSARPPTIIVADRISEAARAQLSRAGVAWLDRRGHLWLRMAGVFVNADVRPSTGPPARRVMEIFTGTGLDVALGLLRFPLESYGVNQLAREIGRSPGRVSEILTELRHQGLAGADNLPITPELFWAVADEWKPRWTPMPAPPAPEPPERYRLTSTLGALALEVPLVAGVAGTWPRLYVADDVDLATVVGAYGSASGSTGSEVAICPSRYGFSWKSSAHRDGYPVANQLVVALDLAQDRARGHEVLEGWDPKEFTRVW